MGILTYKPSFNHEVVKSLTKELFLEQHPEHGDEWEKINKIDVPKEVKAEKVKKDK